MRKTYAVLGVAIAFAAAIPATAQRKPLPAVSMPEKMPYRDWSAMAQVFSSWHGKLMVATVDAPDKLIPCTVKELTATGVTCREKLGHVKSFDREKIAVVARAPERLFSWEDLAGLGFVAAIGGSAGFGTAVLCSIGGAALIAAAPLALVTLAGGMAVVAVSALLFDSRPGPVLYRKPAETVPVVTESEEALIALVALD